MNDPRVNPTENPSGFTIRPELTADWQAVAEVHRQAFDSEFEPWLVECVRQAPGYDPRLSLVGLAGIDVVGHVLLSPIHIEGGERRTPALALAPVAVLPPHQRRGCGSGLVRAGLREAGALQHAIVVVLGHEAYYPRLGFVPAVRYGIRCPFPVPDESFMVLELTPGALAGAEGIVRYPPCFDSAQ